MKYTTSARMLSLGFTVALFACGADNDSEDVVGIDPDGQDYQYIVSKIVVPESPAESTQLGRDITGNGVVDNRLGSLFDGLSSFVDTLDFNGPLSEQISNGSLSILVNVKATDIVDATNVGFWSFFGENASPSPGPCVLADQSDCGLHLAGDAMFDVTSDSPRDSVLSGQIQAGKLFAAGGDLDLKLTIAGAEPLNFSVLEAQVEATITPTGLSNGKVTGAVAVATIEANVLPSVSVLISDLLETDCTENPSGGGLPADCCANASSNGALVLGIFDENDDCAVPIEELSTHPIIQQTILGADIDLDGDSTNDALSVGLGISAVGASFSFPGDVVGL